jgi:hypothetical protein
MIFSRKLARLVTEGRKTQTRRKVKEHETSCRYKVGRHYALQVPAPKSSKARAVTREGPRLEIVDTRSELLANLTLEDAQAEGFKTREDFFDYWRELHGPNADLDVEVWVITFALFFDAPRFLHVNSSRGYTSNARDALPDEPEAVDAETQEAINKQNLHHYNVVHAADLAKREARTIAAQLREARAIAIKKGIDISPDVEALKDQIAELQEKVRLAA